MKPSALLLRAMLVLCVMSAGSFAQIVLEGPVPFEVDFLSVTAQYDRICHVLSPRARPDTSLLKIIYYSKKQKNGPGVTLPEWGGGGAIGCDLIVIPVDFQPFLQQSFSQITVHELVHVALCRAYRGLEIPRWFHEGTAMMLSGQLSSEENIVVSKAIFTNRLMPLASIDSVNGFGRGRADIAYSMSHLAVLFLVDQYGMDALPEILTAARRAHDFWAGVYAATGLTPLEFEQSVINYITSRYKLVFFFTDTYAWWLAIALLFIVGFIVTGMRNKKRAGEMERQEKEEEAKRQEERQKPGPGSSEKKRGEGEEDDNDELEEWEGEEGP